jgi:hypothetical protein
MSSATSRMATSGEVAGPQYDQQGREIKPFGQTQTGSERMLPRFKLSDLEGKTLIITGVEDFDGKFGPGFRVVCNVQETGERGVLLGHWTVIGKYLVRLKEDGDLPVSVKLVKAAGKRYFDFDDPLQPATSLEDASQ